MFFTSVEDFSVFCHHFQPDLSTHRVKFEVCVAQVFLQCSSHTGLRGLSVLLDKKYFRSMYTSNLYKYRQDRKSCPDVVNLDLDVFSLFPFFCICGQTFNLQRQRLMNVDRLCKSASWNQMNSERICRNNQLSNLTICRTNQLSNLTNVAGLHKKL